MRELILAPMAVLTNLAMISIFRLIGDKRGEVTPEPTPEPAPTPSPDPMPAPTPELTPAPAPSAYDTLVAKKGWKSNDDVAKSYEEAEASLGRSQSAYNTTNHQLGPHGYTLDEKGNVVTMQPGALPQDPNQIQPGVPQPGQQQYGQPQGDPVYDPYTGQQITNPVDMQLAQMPLSQRSAVIFNAMADQREKQQSDAFTAENEVLNDPGAKGFENDVRKVMMQVPLASRIKKESWQDALLKVKGIKYDEALKSAGGQAVNDFLNKDQFQTIPSGPGAGDGTVRLNSEQEANFQWYQKNRPDMFKDRAHFLKRSTQTTG